MFNLSQTILSAHGIKELPTLVFAHHQFNIVVKISLGGSTKLTISMSN